MAPQKNEDPAGLAARALDALRHASETSDRAKQVAAYLEAAELSSQLALQAGGTSIHSRLVEIEGTARLRVYELTNEVKHLREAARLLKHAIGQADHEARERITPVLVIALVRLGEQTDSVPLLREAIAVVSAIEGGGDQLTSAMINARAIAELRIGGLTGDVDLVERMIEDLRAHSRLAHLTEEERTQTEQNLATALLENARQNRSLRVYRELIATLDPRAAPPIRTTTAAHFAHLRACALVELSRLDRKPPLAEAARQLIEELVAYRRETHGDVVTALHSLAQANAQLAILTRSAEPALRAIGAVDAAVDGTRVEDETFDARRQRLVADRGAYRLLLYRLTGDEASLSESRRDYQRAATLVDPARAPAVFAQICRGRFELEYGAAEWEAAIDAYQSMEAARATVEADAQLSSGVEDQGPRERAEFGDRYVRCLIETGQVLDAALSIENGRARRLARQYVRFEADESQTGPEALEAISVCLADLKRALASQDDKACRLAASRLRSLRRSLGLDLDPLDSTPTDLQAAAPVGGAFVQLSFSAYGSIGLVWRRGGNVPHRIDLPDDAYPRISGIFHGDDHSLGWLAAYDWFVLSETSPTPGASGRSSDAYRAWCDMIENFFGVLGETVLTPLDHALISIGVSLGAKVILNPPGDLAALPLCSAPVNGAQTFNDRWDASVSPNARLVRETATESSVHAISCVVEPASPVASAPPLAGARREAELLLDRFPHTRVLSGERATPQRVLAELAEARIAHLACHGVYSAMEPAASGLELAHGERLTLSRLQSAVATRYELPLVFLSCCEGGMTGRTVDFNEFVGLPAAFLALGAHAVVAAQWAVYDDAALVFADRFYAFWLDDKGRQKMSPAKALAYAQSWMRTATREDLTEVGLWDAVAGTATGAGEMRLRRLGDTPTFSSVHESVYPSCLRTRTHPFSSPHDWAAFTVLGE